jgi:D-alanyl-D-alanine dipeptidase
MMKRIQISADVQDVLVQIDHPNIDVDLAYATEINFTGMKLYADSRPWLHKEAASALYRAANLAAAARLRVRLLDAFRPTSVQEELWNIRPDPDFVTDPRIGSDHTRGIAVDLTLADRSGNCLDMGTDFDAALVASHHGPVEISDDAHRNRLMLAGLMTVAGFIINPLEWWHYALPNHEAYPLLL